MRQELAMSAILVLTNVAAARATQNHAHYHYMIGSRTQYALTHARILHLEASSPGTNLVLSRSNAETMRELSTEILHWVGAASAVASHEERRWVEREFNWMASLASQTLDRSNEMLRAIDDELATATASAGRAPSIESDGPEASDGLRRTLAAGAQDLYFTFLDLLASHKRAEEKLGIPVPPEPPPKDEN